MRARYVVVVVECEHCVGLQRRRSVMLTKRHLVVVVGLLMATMLLFYQLELLPGVEWSGRQPEGRPPDTRMPRTMPHVSVPMVAGDGGREASGDRHSAGVEANPSPPAQADSAETHPSLDDCDYLDKPLGLTVEAPVELETCARAVFTLRSVDGEDLRGYCPLVRLELDCEVETSDLSNEGDRVALEGVRRVRKTVYAHPVIGKHDEISLNFFPDGSTDYCHVEIAAVSDQVVLDGATELDYDVEPFTPKSGVFCFQCRPMLYRDIPDAASFALWRDGLWAWEWEPGVTLAAGVETIVWVRPLPWARDGFDESVFQDIQFNGILRSDKTIEAAPVSLTWDEGIGGYAVSVSTKDAGLFALDVTMNFIFGGSEYLSGQPTPICTSSHMRHEYSACDKERSDVLGSGIELRFVDDRRGRGDDISIFTSSDSSHCVEVHAPGRWVRLDTRYDCYPPYCTGDRFFSLVNSMSWQGATFDHVWMPYDCYFHFYTEEDFTHCANELDISWIHVMGDSLPREVAAYLMSIFGSPDTNKFETADQGKVLGETGIRISFQAWQDIILSGPSTTRGKENFRYEQFIVTMLDHYNFLQKGTSTIVEDANVNLSLPALTGSPQVFIVNPAMAYALFKQTERSYADFVKKFLRQTKEMCTTGTDGRPPVRCIWYGNPYIVAAAHDGSDFLTESRNENFRQLTIAEVESNGYVYYDPTYMTRSRPEECWDGLHYLRGYEEWNGHVASNNVQVLLNLLFGDCKGPQ